MNATRATQTMFWVVKIVSHHLVLTRTFPFPYPSTVGSNSLKIRLHNNTREGQGEKYNMKVMKSSFLKLVVHMLDCNTDPDAATASHRHPLIIV